MAKIILIYGASGSGKSRSLKNLDASQYALINVMGKELPFKSTKPYKVTTDYSVVKQSLLDYAQKTDTIVIDDAGYLITDQFMAGHAAGKGNAIFELYNSMADNFYRMIRFIKTELPPEKIVYIFMLEDIDEFGFIKPKTIGKMLDDKVNIPGLFTIVLRAMKKDNKYIFRTQGTGFDVTKSPEEMFSAEEIDNDLKLVNDAIKGYYK